MLFEREETFVTAKSQGCQLQEPVTPVIRPKPEGSEPATGLRRRCYPQYKSRSRVQKFSSLLTPSFESHLRSIAAPRESACHCAARAGDRCLRMQEAAP